MRWPNFLIPMLLLMTLFSSCSFQDLELKGVEGFEMSKLENGKMEGVMRVKIHNPNSFPITVTKADLDVFAAAVRVGDAHLSENIKIKANSEESYDVKIDANIENVLTGGLGGIVNMLAGKSPTIKLEGQLKARSFLVSKTVPVSLETAIPMNR